MKILFDITHPAHVYFFLNPIAILKQRGHQILLTSREKEFATTLLDQYNLAHTPLSRLQNKGALGLLRELVVRNLRLMRFVKKHKPDVMAGIGGIFIAQVGRLSGIPSCVFYDTENARLQNALTYPFATQVIVPACYEAWVPQHHHQKYAGYHELSYLHPDYFKPQRELALANGLAEQGDTFFIRLVSWQANHDIGEQGWTLELTNKVVTKLAQRGKVLISSEAPLPHSLKDHQYQGDISQIHHLLAHCRLFVGESATMASECAVLGVPAIYIAHTGRGYTNEQEKRYGLVSNLATFDAAQINDTIDNMLAQPPAAYQEKQKQLLDDCIDVASYIADVIEGVTQ